jgi:hypothetical protein
MWQKMCIYKCMLNVYKNQQNRQTGSRNLKGPKTLPTIWGTYMKLVTKYQISAMISCWEKSDEKWAYMFNVYKNQQGRQTGSRDLMGQNMLPTIWGTYMKLVTKYQISAINSCWEKCDEKCAYNYMFNVYKNQLSRQTGSRNLTSPKTLPTIWYTYMKLVTKYQIPAINSYWEKCDEKYLGWTEVKQYTPLPLRGAGGIKTIFRTAFPHTTNGFPVYSMRIYATVKNISVVLWLSALLVEGAWVPWWKPLPCHKHMLTAT